MGSTQFVYSSNTPPYAVSFTELKQTKYKQDMRNDLVDLLYMFTEMADRVIYEEYDPSMYEDKTPYEMLQTLLEEFGREINQTEKLYDGKKPGYNEDEDKSLIRIKNKHLLAKSKLQESGKNFILYKNQSGELIWAGIHTNKFQDRDNPPDLLTEASHKRFIEKVYSGEYELPELWIWHIQKAVGEVNWMAWDERGFLLSGGKVLKEFEDVVESLTMNELNMGMSHGMPIDSIVYDEDGDIIEYQSIEVSLVPLSSVANILTDFSVIED